MVDEFQLIAIIAKAISAFPLEGPDGQHSLMTNEQATCVAKAMITAVAEAGLTISAEPPRAS